MIAVVVVDYRRHHETLACLRSVLSDGPDGMDVWLMENAPEEAFLNSELARFVRSEPAIRMRSFRHNLGFAEACNRAFEEILADTTYEVVVLLNNDAIADPGFCEHMLRVSRDGPFPAMVAAQMDCMDSTGTVDSMGITLYRCGLAGNRRNLDEPLLGPCGGAALYPAPLLRDLRERTGEWFDTAYFCYAEDTDLALRARMLGYSCRFAPEARVKHHGSLTSGGSDSDFVAIHGLRNSLVTLVKDIRFSRLLLMSPWIAGMVAGVVFKYLWQLRLGVLLGIMGGFFALLPHALRGRSRLRKAGLLREISYKELVSPKFYQPGYVRQHLRKSGSRK